MSAWLIDVLDAALPQLTGGERDKIAEQILAALPSKLIAETIAISARSVLVEKFGERAGWDRIAVELGNNVGGAVLVMLQATGADAEAFCAGNDCAWDGHESQLVDGQCPDCGAAALVRGA